MEIRVTFKDHAEADNICRSLLEQKLIACANTWPVQSQYRWRGKIERSQEVMAVLKAKSEDWEAIEHEIKRLHSYEVPVIVRIEANLNTEALNWVNDETN